MNGFANTLLTLLLSWLRVLINNLWRVLSSEDGGAFYQFLSANWKVLVLVLCVGGFVIDRIIYLFRWRPYYVWMSKLRRLRHAPSSEQVPEETPLPAMEPGGQDAPYADTPYPDASYPNAPYAQAPVEPYAPSGGTQVYRPINTFAPEADTRLFEAGHAPAFQPEIASYAPASPDFPPQTAYAPPQPETLEPVFDEEPVWEAGAAWQNPAAGMEHSFGAPRPEPVAYIRDMQAGFAPPVPPEQLYAPPAATAQPPADAVHPGLDDAALRQSFGLTQPPPIVPPQASPLSGEMPEDADEARDGRLFVMRAPTFQPFTSRGGSADRARGPLARLARKARDLVGDSEENRPTIHDLQSTVDVSQAFHEPVYPQPRQGGDEE